MTSRRLLTPATRALLDAASYIEQHGWARRSFERSNGSVCVMGALDHVTDLDVTHDAACRRIRTYLGMGDSAYWSLPAWNDQPGRSKAEVLAVLRGAALS